MTVLRKERAHRALLGSPTVKRLGATFAGVLLLFALALGVVLHAMGEIAEAEREVAALDHAKNAGHRVAALVREQYIHQAHTIIEWNRSHVGHYGDVVARTRAATEELVNLAKTGEEQSVAREIAALVRKNDGDFVTVTLPAIDRDEHDEVANLHAATEEIVARVVTLVEQLNGRFEARSEAARARADRLRSRVRSTTMACFGAATLLAAAVATVVLKNLGGRLAALRGGVEGLGKGDLSRRIALDGDDELSDLARRFDEMAARLEKHQQEMLQEQKLASIGRLCAGVAHEINGPLGIILGFAKVIRRQGLDEEALGAIEAEAKHCQRIVEALLDTSRHESAAFDPVDIAALAHEGVERLRAIGKLARRRVEVRSSGSYLAAGDEAKLRQVVLNLLTNAVEATSEDGRIVVSIETERGRVVLVVEDEGPGLSTEAREHLFEPFFTTKEQGTGLGLAISRAIVEAHRGEIHVRAGDVRGARFEIHLHAHDPLVEAAP
jgi:two-component system NtrC family sensor kinase